ncbi:GLPGLI family protein [Pontibacter sp. FD36]|uniref:GLPGLI family protein n=1 Tax=Pontibacter sp. FD36 TaxID=2789860 RepID=UPI0018A9DA35|nr:GLPGLI family protein [Pontibacter sp. FD36]MBF8963144.1 GLPGLI family protein [Pontibacter sp. FD36]
MKNFFSGILTLALLLLAVDVYAQEGVITYENTMNMHRRLGPEQEAMKSMIPEYRTTKQQLFYNAQESLYKALEEDEDQFTASGGGMRINMRVPLNESYYDQGTAQKVLLTEFMGKKYIIEDSIRISPWKFGTETKEIQGYTCKQAYYEDEARKTAVVAWYTDKLRPALGPESYNTLPGAVLAVDINNGERVIKAIKVEQRPLKKGEISRPVKGQKVTQQEYQAMVDEQMERMRQNGGRNVIIR